MKAKLILAALTLTSTIGTALAEQEISAAADRRRRSVRPISSPALVWSSRSSAQANTATCRPGAGGDNECLPGGVGVPGRARAAGREGHHSFFDIA